MKTAEERLEQWIFRGILFAVIILGTGYNIVTPPWQFPDEFGHHDYIHFVQFHHRLPSYQFPTDSWEYHQPPLYYISEAIDSVLSQDFKDLEIVVVDDGSTDDTKEVLKKYGVAVRYIYQENKGISGARNRGILESKGEYIAFLDSDDVWLDSTKLTQQVAILENNPKVGIVYSKMMMVNDKGEKVGIKPEKDNGTNFKELIEIGGHLPTSTLVARKACFEKVGLFDEALPILEDFDMWLRISRLYDIVENKGKVFGYYHKRDNKVMRDKSINYKAQVLLLQKILKSFPEAPEGLVKLKLVENQYMLSRVYYEQGKYKESFLNVCQALGKDIFLGKLFIEARDNILKKLIKLVKPHLFFMICFWKMKRGS
jgi:glycosyltransferase involved in cell wall biosynthesis